MITALVIVETGIVVALTVLVIGLLRAYATVLRRLHTIDGGERQFSVAATARSAVGDPQRRDEWAEAHDVVGTTLNGELVATRVVGVERDTVLLFLSAGCSSCAAFWTELSDPALARPPTSTRLVVVAQDADADSPHALAELAPRWLDVVLSSAAWRDYEVPGSPYVVLVGGRTGRVRGEGTGQSWRQIEELLARATGDGDFVGIRPDLRKPRSDREREAEVDRELLAAGILPGDARLYQLPDRRSEQS